MKPFYLLLISFIILLIAAYLFTGSWQWTFAGNISMALMLCFTALGHFMFTKGMVLMIPSLIPFRKTLVIITGFAEIALAILLCIPSTRYLAAIITLILFIILLPANIYAATHRINYEKADLTGPGPSYLWIRIPMQLFFIIWIYIFAINLS